MDSCQAVLPDYRLSKKGLSKNWHFHLLAQFLLEFAPASLLIKVRLIFSVSQLSKLCFCLFVFLFLCLKLLRPLVASWARTTTVNKIFAKFFASPSSKEKLIDLFQNNFVPTWTSRIWFFGAQIELLLKSQKRSLYYKTWQSWLHNLVIHPVTFTFIIRNRLAH